MIKQKEHKNQQNNIRYAIVENITGDYTKTLVYGAAAQPPLN